MRNPVGQGVASLLLGVLLLLPYVPITHFSLSHGHCKHCTGSYCIRSDHGRTCTCRHGSMHGAPTAESDHDGMRHDDHSDPTMTTSVIPCGTSAAGVVTPSLDKFIPAIRRECPSAGADTPRPITSEEARDQVRLNSVFRPPVTLA